MPSGVYDRKPWMRNSGKTCGLRDDIRELYRRGWTVAELSKAFQVRHDSVRRILKHEWNPAREKRTRPFKLTGNCALCKKPLEGDKNASRELCGAHYQWMRKKLRTRQEQSDD